MSAKTHTREDGSSADSDGDSPGPMHKVTSNAVHAVTNWAGSIYASAAVALVVFLILLVGAVFRFPHSWQVLVHSLGAIVSLLMLFLIQHTTNQQTNAVLLKLDELIHATSDARDEVIDAEDRTVEEQDDLEEDLHENY
ncbi:low affinity iron permease family protein [Antrihabitans sp. YC2-6]|uniref:low affinity iron permease family protein n=1 Tax=Antrihabitans sp. YC2-6 TaxID=2799498 RepID=UPI0018F6120A|nr:low affinity iron permease family protein [Antrihabitans sp. YC2-6]MBJ8345790.1 low affinity iron permease family protein [Antrihabitans sp. YC2-6]